VSRTVFDATVICGAFVRPFSANYQLLALADDGVIDGFATDVAAYEFVRHARAGSLSRDGVPAPEALIAGFFDGFPNLFDPATTPRVSIGRNVLDRAVLFGRPVGQVVHELTGRSRADLVADLEEQQVVGIDDFDPADLHLLVAAVEQKADTICTSNTTDFKQASYGEIRIIRPHELLAELNA
jgi:hypothetical protein